MVEKTAASGNSTTYAGEDTATTTVKYEVVGGYTWSVPTEIDFGANQGVDKSVKVNATGDKNSTTELPDVGTSKNGTAPKVTVDKNVIPSHKKLVIKVSSEQYDASTGYYVKSAESDNFTKLDYKIAMTSEGTALTNNAEVVSLNAGTDTYA